MKPHSQQFHRLALLGLVLFLLQACASLPKQMQGKWQGIGNQVDGQTWEVIVDATDLKKLRVQYPSLDCGGDWKLEKKGKGTLHMREKLTFGLQNCDQDVEVVIQGPDNGELYIEYYIRSMDPNQPIATAQLQQIPKQ